MPRRRNRLTVVRIPAGAGIAGVALGLTSGRDDLLGVGMPRRRNRLTVVRIPAGTGIAGVALGLTDGEDELFGVCMSHRRQGGLHGLSADRAGPRCPSLGRTGGRGHGLPFGCGMLMIRVGRRIGHHLGRCVGGHLGRPLGWHVGGHLGRHSGWLLTSPQERAESAHRQKKPRNAVLHDPHQTSPRNVSNRTSANT